MTSAAEPAEEESAAVAAVLEQLSAPGGMARAERRIGGIAPDLRSLLDDALTGGGWFDEAFESVLLKAATAPDSDDRLAQVRNLVSEQTRLGMLVGVAIGWELGERLAERRSSGLKDEPPDPA